MGNALINNLQNRMLEKYQSDGFVMDFDEFIERFSREPERHLRNAARYTMDAMNYFGSTEVEKPHGIYRHYHIFDIPYDNGNDRLIGQEEVQERFHGILNSFIRQGRIDKLLLLHGPNGSSKSTFISSLLRGLEEFSKTEEGILYKFSWVFPTSSHTQKGIGFDNHTCATDGGGRQGGCNCHNVGDNSATVSAHISRGSSGGNSRTVGHNRHNSFAYLNMEHIESEIPCELADNPLFLIPAPDRQKLIEQVMEKNKEERSSEDGGNRAFIPADYILKGDLCHKCRQIFDALLKSYGGDYRKVLQHVRVERHFISRRYRKGAITVEPQLRVDAATRQITYNRSLTALPPTLQNVTLFEPYGDLIDANRGILEFNDLLKRPVEAYKYILSTCEKATVSLDSIMAFLDVLFLGSTNEKHLAAFKELPDFATYKGRIELLKVPYLLDYHDESKIYEEQIKNKLDLHVAPHTMELAAAWAVMTRLRRCEQEKYPTGVGSTAGRLSPGEKAELYATGHVPGDLTSDEAKELKNAIGRIRKETENHPLYEGGSGASPREIKTMFMECAEKAEHGCLTPLGMIRGLEELVQEKSVYDFLNLPPDGQYHKPADYIDSIRVRYIDSIEEDIRECTGLVEDSRYLELFSRYVDNVNGYLRGDKKRDRLTGKQIGPDEGLMRQVEASLDAGEESHKFRENLLSRIAAFHIENPDKAVDYQLLFPEYFRRLQAAYCNGHIAQIRRILKGMLLILDPEARQQHIQVPVSDDDADTACEQVGQEASEGAAVNTGSGETPAQCIPMPDESTQARNYRAQAEETIKAMYQKGYCPVCVGEAAALLLKTRYRE